ncbi:MAG: VIT1/CCC1 transporter family protein [Methanotrichaceae archaeon]|nr:VIT1/CCC1 transporter family protein [Methanotrichaceae archaeon]MDD1758819.1 VIT1/CCC1 transporter family protein [Methanotrichaceae archaeon]
MRLSDYIGTYWAGAEVMYAVIIAMTFTSTLRGPITHFETDYYNVVYAALFCCIAWGIADGLFYTWERTYNIRLENKIIEFSKAAEKNEAAIPLIREELDDTILRNIDEKVRYKLYHQLVKHLAEVGMVRKPSARDAFNIISGTFVAASMAGLIVVLPFFLIDSPIYALRISNLLGISLLFISGYYRALERNLSNRIILGFGTAIIGIIIAAITTWLGG